MPIGPAGFAHLFVFGILIPWSAIRSKALIESRPLPPRRRYFVSVLIQTTIFALLSIFVARLEWVALVSPVVPPLRALLAGALFLAIAIPFGWTRWRKAVRERKKIVALFMPRNNVERLLWIGTALVAGIGEEITWRGVQTTLLTRVTGSIPLAIILAIVMFSVAHAVQGWRSAAVIVVFAAGFHALVVLAGSLYVAMAVHFLYDLVAGFSYGYLGRKMGYDVSEPSAVPPPVPSTDAV